MAAGCSCCPRWCCSARSWSTRSGTRSYRSFFDQSGSGFAGLDNYVEIFTDDTILTAVKNNAIWVVVAPAVVDGARADLRGADRTGALGHGVQADRLHADGDLDAGRGHHLPAGVRAGPGARASPTRSWVGVHDTFAESAGFPKARPLPAHPLKPAGGGAFVTEQPVTAGSPVELPLVGVPADTMPSDAPPGEGRTTGRRPDHRHRLAGLHPGRRRRR